MTNYVDHNVTILTPIVTEQEDAALRTSMDVLGAIQSMFKDDLILVSIETGEVVTIEELSRVRGVIDAFYRHQHWKVEKSED